MENNRFYRVCKAVRAHEIIGEIVALAQAPAKILYKCDILYLLQKKTPASRAGDPPLSRRIIRTFDLVFMDPKNLSRWLLRDVSLQEFDIYFEEINLSHDK